ncbi:hypothetical protein [Treponema putidum]|uniref:hypothetical protein n=1 Tax=Treponema putidum TaxID=221027 RepID=UPI003D8BA093
MGKYGKCLVSEYKDLQKFYKKYKKQDDALLEYGKKIAQITKNTNQYIHAGNRFDLLYCDIKGYLLHLYFLDKELKNFLINIDLPNMKNAIEFINEQSYETLYPILDSKSKKHIQFCIHVPDEPNGYVFRIAQNDEKNDLTFFIIDNTEESYLAVFKQGINSKIGCLIKLAVNTLFYINCFSDCVVNGIPKDVKLDSSFSCPKFSVKITDKIKIKSGTGETHLVSSHFRRGHFRYFPADSEYFVNKKETTIWIEATTVKGNNKIVLTDDSIKEERQ